jgi:hypothetical protein
MMISSILTDEEILAFFTASKQLGISKKTVEKLKEEGIKSPGDLIDFDKDTLHQLAENLRKAPKQELDKEGDLVCPAFRPECQVP